MLGEPFGTFGNEEQSKQLYKSDSSCNSQNDPPHIASAEEVAEELRDENSQIDHDLG